MSDLTAEAENPGAAKLALRNRLLTARRALTTSARRASAAHLQDQLLELVRRERPATIAAYVPIGPEPGGADLPAVLAATGARVLLPVLLPDNDLDWAVFTGTLAPGPRGLAEPVGARLGVDGIRSADLILVPALAVDRAGRRMGRGGGSYDRALARLDAPNQTPARIHDPDQTPARIHDPDQTPARIHDPDETPARIYGSHHAPNCGPHQAPGPVDGPDRAPAPIDGPRRKPDRSREAGAAGGAALVVALLQDGELLDSVPAEPHDRPVHGVITPSGGHVALPAGRIP